MNSAFFGLLFPQSTNQTKTQAANPDQQKTAIIEKAGGRVATVAQNDNHLEVDLHLGGSADDATLAAIAGLKDVVFLNLGKTGLTDAGLAQIKGMTTLTHL